MLIQGQAGTSNHHSLLETSLVQLPRAHLAVFTNPFPTLLNLLHLVFSSQQWVFQQKSFIVHHTVHQKLSLKVQSMLKPHWEDEAGGPALLSVYLSLVGWLFLAWLVKDLTLQDLECRCPVPWWWRLKVVGQAMLIFAVSPGHQQGGQPQTTSHLSTILTSCGMEPGLQTECGHSLDNISSWTHSPSQFLKFHGSWFPMETSRNLF